MKNMRAAEQIANEMEHLEGEELRERTRQMRDLLTAARATKGSYRAARANGIEIGSGNRGCKPDKCAGSAAAKAGILQLARISEESRGCRRQSEG